MNYKKILLKDLFDIVTTKSQDKGSIKIYQNYKSGRYPFIGRTNKNNGVQGYIKKCIFAPNPSKVFSISQIGSINAQYRDFEWYASQNIIMLIPKYKCVEQTSLYMVTVLQKLVHSRYDSGYSNYPTTNKLKELYINLPTDINNNIDFFFMIDYIKSLKLKAFSKILNYISDTGYKNLDSMKITKKDLYILDRHSKVSFKEFNITDLFSIRNTHCILSSDIIENSGNIPYLTAMSGNNSLKTRINYDSKYMDNGNCIFIGGKTLVVNYQPESFFSNDSHNLALYLKNDNYKLDINIYQYFVSVIYNSLKDKYTWNDSISKKKITHDKIALPTINNEPDYEIMSKFIEINKKITLKNLFLSIHNVKNLS